MDLLAYVQIKDLSAVAKANGIEVRRLRGYRLMAAVEPLTSEEWKHMLFDAKIDAYEKVMRAEPPFSLDPRGFSYEERSDRRSKKYLIVKKRIEVITNEKYPDGYEVVYEDTVGIRWDRLHGKKRKAAKYYEKHHVRMVKHQYSLWDQYAGRQDVLYIHARLGSCAWSDTHWWDYESAPWFLAACDDTYDPTYCDIYAKIDPESVVVA